MKRSKIVTRIGKSGKLLTFTRASPWSRPEKVSYHIYLNRLVSRQVFTFPFTPSFSRAWRYRNNEY